VDLWEVSSSQVVPAIRAHVCYSREVAEKELSDFAEGLKPIKAAR
jgi:hypothetical protein